jgi:RNA polymerase sigma-70 factor (ECF subfamily)
VTTAATIPVNDDGRDRSVRSTDDSTTPFEPGRVRNADEVVERVDLGHGQNLFGLARRAGLDDEAAEDAVQETLVRLWLEVRSGTVVLDPPAWSFRTVYRIAMDQHRVRRRLREIVERIGRQPPPPPPDMVQQLTIWSLVDRLPLRQRQVVYLRYRADMTFEEIALVMAITPSGARAHSAKANASLRRLAGSTLKD